VAGSDSGDRLARRTVASVTLARQAAAGSNGRLGTAGFGARVSPDGRRTYVGGAAAAPAVSLARQRRPAPELTVPVAEFSAMALSPDGRTLYWWTPAGRCACSMPGPLRAHRPVQPGQLRLLRAGAAVSPDGRELYLSNPHKRLDVVDLVGRGARSAPCR